MRLPEWLACWITSRLVVLSPAGSSSYSPWFSARGWGRVSMDNQDGKDKDKSQCYATIRCEVLQDSITCRSNS
ncbi:uncharacterized protein K460DRAFT_138703 [Cucurbitaria berberidis CBS 394.84]|uniref:Secreted protein n=1 Tax=Cucurbitaria berberidis CBS 394.84 TaxID=1168544 RepID=A0A9P4L6H2_9PLEO|nr:uncharacterized protein K460DRAFT_138703 [Cucurbitaria berberidis CBS 394.84]KAF1843053.1 hypothetical protein K460DRAFT_138703 [Cucurbitaria berberidis CBS 394.84]